MQQIMKGRFRPGQSGNPGGRPRVPEEVREMLQALTPRAVVALAEALDGDDARLRFLAAQEVLNRSLGKPHQSTDVEVKKGKSLQELHLQAMIDFKRHIAPRVPANLPHQSAFQSSGAGQPRDGGS